MKPLTLKTTVQIVTLVQYIPKVVTTWQLEESPEMEFMVLVQNKLEILAKIQGFTTTGKYVISSLRNTSECESYELYYYL